MDVSAERWSSVSVAASSATDVGRRRSVNEDSLLAEFPIFLVADGMGGHDAGDRASAAVVREFERLVGRHDLTPLEVVDALTSAHAVVRTLAESTARGAGSTLAGVAVVHQDGEPRWLTFNLGDSRVYRFFDESLEQLTTDHSIVQELVDEGKLDRSQMNTYEGRNVITRAVGADSWQADYWLAPIVSGERIMICSDGLTGEVTDEVILASLALSGSPAEAARNLVRLAVENGGRDNVSVVVLDVTAGGLSSDADETTGARGLIGALEVGLEDTTITNVRRRAPHA